MLALYPLDSPRRALALALIAALCVGCGDPSDRPSDCTPNEFFDEIDQICQTCPALAEPSCRPGCGILVSTDDRGCPSASCDLSCSVCPEGTRFEEGTLSCQPDCDPGQFYSPQQGCQMCPSLQDAPSSCEDLPCRCELVERLDERGCPERLCARCSDPDEGASVDEDGLCLAPSDAPTDDDEQDEGGS